MTEMVDEQQADHCWMPPAQAGINGEAMQSFLAYESPHAEQTQ